MSTFAGTFFQEVSLSPSKITYMSPQKQLMCHHRSTDYQMKCRRRVMSYVVTCSLRKEQISPQHRRAADAGCMFVTNSSEDSSSIATSPAVTMVTSKQTTTAVSIKPWENGCRCKLPVDDPRRNNGERIYAQSIGPGKTKLYVYDRKKDKFKKMGSYDIKQDVWIPDSRHCMLLAYNCDERQQTAHVGCTVQSYCMGGQQTRTFASGRICGIHYDKYTQHLYFVEYNSKEKVFHPKAMHLNDKSP